MNDPLRLRSIVFGWSVSLALHVGIALLARVVLTLPDSGFEFEVPLEMELGLVEATEVVEPSATNPPEPPTSASDANASSSGTSALDAGVPKDASADAAAGDGGRRDAGRRRIRDAGRDAASPTEGELEGPPVAFLPRGAQLALRIDLDRVRDSPLESDVREILALIPDWRAILGDSGIDPLRDVSRVLLATPNLQRQSVIIAGRLTSSAPDPRALTERLAEAEGATAEWRTLRGGAIATHWPSPDATARDVALLEGRHFVIARPADLPRVLAIAAARRSGSGETPMDALLALDGDASLGIEVENVSAFARRSPCAVPARLSLAALSRESGVDVIGTAVFDAEVDAQSAAECLSEIAARFATNTLVSLTGMSGPLERLTLAADRKELHIHTSLRWSELRTALGLMRSALGAPGSPPANLPPR